MEFRHKKPSGIFINTARAQCSIFESGLMMYESLLTSSRFKIDYVEVDEKNRTIPAGYDFYTFNYHYSTMGWLDTKSVSRLPGVKITFVLETLPNDPFVLCPENDFDAYCALDPTMDIEDKRVYAFSRPLEVPADLVPHDESPVPVIGSFGFATPGKGFELLVDAVNREFEEALVRINIPAATYVDAGTWKLQQQDYTRYLGDLCVKIAKKGVRVEITNAFMSKDELIRWCGRNTLNCFLYNRNQPGLSATTDQAISSGRPLSVSANETFRHICRYIEPYPIRSLKESIALSKAEVLQMQKDWVPVNFAARFEDVLRDFGLFEKSDHEPRQEGKIKLKKRVFRSIAASAFRQVRRIKKIKFLDKPVEAVLRTQRQQLYGHRRNEKKISAGDKQTILLVSHKEKQCGIYQYAVNIFEALKKSDRYAFEYSECADSTELQLAVAKTVPRAIIYNYYPITMSWLTGDITRRYQIPQLGIMHETTQEKADGADRNMFDFHLCPDPTLIENNPFVFKTKRLIPPYINTRNLPDVVTIGSFGFGFVDKGFERLVEQLMQEFDRARIMLHLPFNEIVDSEGRDHALATAKRCRRLVQKRLLTKPKIRLTIRHDFLSKPQLLDFLAGNTLNAFLYDADKKDGISSAIEYALAVQRPFAITKCGMFRHVYTATPSICVEDLSLKQIINNGIVPLVPFYNEWSEANFIKDFEGILDKVLYQRQVYS